jgi:hypothetical protein
MLNEVYKQIAYFQYQSQVSREPQEPLEHYRKAIAYNPLDFESAIEMSSLTIETDI